MSYESAILTNSYIYNTSNNIGINNNNPLYKCDVSGDVNGIGNLKINNTNVLSGSTLYSNVINSSLISLGTLLNIQVSGGTTFSNLYCDSINGNTSIFGTQGNQGYYGNQGNDGNNGVIGYQGYQGYSNTIGNQGNIGIQGSGYQGFQGNGTNGIQGIQGNQGPSSTFDNTTINNNVNVASGFVYQINSTSILSSTTLGSPILLSSLTSMGGTLTINNNTSTALLNFKGTSTNNYGKIQFQDTNASTYANIYTSSTALNFDIKSLSNGLKFVNSSGTTYLSFGQTGTITPAAQFQTFGLTRFTSWRFNVYRISATPFTIVSPYYSAYFPYAGSASTINLPTQSSLSGWDGLTISFVQAGQSSTQFTVTVNAGTSTTIIWSSSYSFTANIGKGGMFIYCESESNWMSLTKYV